MNRNKAIRNVLDLTYKEYDNYRTEQYTDWCKKYARKFMLPLRTLLGHDHLMNWYHSEWLREVENKFYEENADYITKELEHREAFADLFRMYPQTIMAHYPKPIIDMIKAELKITDERPDKVKSN